METGNMSSLQLGSVETFPPGEFWVWEYRNILIPKNQTRNIVTI